MVVGGAARKPIFGMGELAQESVQGADGGAEVPMTTCDPVWETIYADGRQLNQWPYDGVVSFVFRHRPRDRARGETVIAEVGCGAGNNVRFAAREGFVAWGLDGSASAIDVARARVADDGTEADLQVGDFTALPWPTDSVDLAIDRGSLTCVGFAEARRAYRELARVVRRGGLLYTTPFSTAHSSAAGGRAAADGRRVGIDRGRLQGVGGIAFWDEPRLLDALGSAWDLVELRHVVETNALDADDVRGWIELVARRR